MKLCSLVFGHPHVVQPPHCHLACLPVEAGNVAAVWSAHGDNDVMWLCTWIPSTCISSEGISPPQTRWWISQHKLPPPPGLWSRLSANYWTFFCEFFLRQCCDVQDVMHATMPHVTQIRTMRYLIIFPVGNLFWIHDDILTMFVSTVSVQGQDYPQLTVVGLDTEGGRYALWPV